MKKKSLLLRFAVLVAAMMCALGASAVEAYACYTSSNTTLTFYYDNYRSSRTGTTYDLNTGNNDTGWDTDGTKSYVTKVVFDPSFANFRPTTTYDWFYRMQNLESITGMSYLNTSEVTRMGWMFANCTKLTSLDLSNFNTSQVTDMAYMFNGSSNLRTIYVDSGWSTAAVTNSESMFANCTSLVGGQGTTWSTYNPKDKTYARIDGGTSNPGYFTEKNPLVAYANYTPSNTTLTFYYDNLRSTRTGSTYDLNTGSNYTGWEIGGVSVYVTKVVFDPSFANARPTTTYSWFYGMNNLQSITGLNYLNTSEVTNMGFMFGGCNQLTSLDVSNWNTSKVTTMNGLFYNCRGLTSLDLNSFNTSKVTDMDQMFDNCNNLRTIYVGNGWSTAAVTYSNYMFFGCTNLVGGQGTTYSPSNPTNKTYAHIDGGPSNPGYFTAPPEAYACYTPSNTTLTFYYDNLRSSRTGTTYDLNTGSNYTGWDTDGTRSNVTKVVFDSSFAGARPTSTCDWFFDMQNLQTIQGIEYLNTSEVTNMNWMFMKCTKLTSLDVSHFNTSKVISMTQMFYGSSNLRTIYVSNGWSTAAVTTSENMFYNCTSLVGGQGTTYDANHIDKAYARIDGGPSSPGYFTDKNAPVAYACYTPSNTTLTFYYDNYRSYRPGTTYDLNEGNNWPGWMSDGTAASVTRVVFNSSFAGARPSSTQAWFADMANLQSVSGMQYLNTSEVTNMFYMFAYCGLPSLNLSYLNTSNVTSMEGMFLNSSFTSLDVSSFNTSKVVDMNEMFAYCYNLTSLDLSNFNTSKVTNMEGMFNESISLESINMSNWNTSNVTDMSYMFNECNALSSIDVSHFNTSKVTDMQSMFTYCTSLTSLDLRNFDTSNVTNMESMFNNCRALESLNVSNWNTSNVTNMGYMFANCSRLTSLDLGGFNTSKVTLMWYMFAGCSQLVTIYAGSGWSTAAVSTSTNMFYNCTSLVGGQGTTWNSSNPTDKTYAHIEGGTSNPGYFTDKNAGLRGDVNGDGQVKIDDVTALINLLLSGNTSAPAADCNLDGKVAIGDVTALINYLLSSTW